MSEHDFSTITLTHEGAVASIALNRPDEANGLNTTMAAELAQAAKACAGNQSTKAVILTGNGRFFCAGGDVKSMLEFGDQVDTGLKGLADDLHDALATFARMDAPLIVAVNGTAAGAGFSMAVAGDLVLAVDTAKFTMAYSNIGLSPDGGASWLLPRLVGLRKTQELMFTNRVLSASEALDWGLINQVVSADDLLPEARKLAGKLAAGARGSHSAIKSLLLASYENQPEVQMELEGKTIAANAASADGREGVRAFVEKRKPDYQG